MAPPIFDGLSWGTMLAAVEDVVTELERCAAELRAIVDRHRPVDVDAAPPRLVAVLPGPIVPGELLLEPLNGRLRVLELELESSPIAGRPGWRVDRAGREWYSSSWLDRGPV